jgi:hypothetical protein
MQMRSTDFVWKWARRKSREGQAALDCSSDNCAALSLPKPLKAGAMNSKGGFCWRFPARNNGENWRSLSLRANKCLLGAIFYIDARSPAAWSQLLIYICVFTRRM